MCNLRCQGIVNYACQLHSILNTLKQHQSQDKKELISYYRDSVDFVILLIVGKQKLSTLLTLVIFTVKEAHKYDGEIILAMMTSSDITITYL